MINIDFKFDFKKAFDDAFSDSETYQNISYIAKCFNVDERTAESAVRLLIETNVKIFSSVMEQYNSELLNEIER